MKILMIGDIVGRNGRHIIADCVPDLRQKHGLDFVVANIENAAAGFLNDATNDSVDSDNRRLAGGHVIEHFVGVCRPKQRNVPQDRDAHVGGGDHRRRQQLCAPDR